MLASIGVHPITVDLGDVRVLIVPGGDSYLEALIDCDEAHLEEAFELCDKYNLEFMDVLETDPEFREDGFIREYLIEREIHDRTT